MSQPPYYPNKENDNRLLRVQITKLEEDLNQLRSKARLIELEDALAHEKKLNQEKDIIIETLRSKTEQDLGPPRCQCCGGPIKNGDCWC